MEKKIATIVSAFINVPAEQIGISTKVDRTAVKSSITLHRMYARLAEEGFAVSNYMEVKSFGDLMQRVVGSDRAIVANTTASYIIPEDIKNQSLNDSSTIGIDIEEVESMPHANDFREAEFYKMNFATSEIAWCILRPDSYASFAGLFAAKEALVKADPTYKGQPFNTIVIVHDPEGKPLFPGFALSITHSGKLAIAVAISGISQNNGNLSKPTRPNSKLPLLISLLALCIAIASIFLK